MIKLKLEKVVNTDKNGKEVKDGSGNLTHIRHDAISLSQLINAIDSKAVAVGEYKALISIDDKCREALKQDYPEIELTVDESALLKKLLSNPQNDRISFSLFHIRTIDAVLEQLR